MKLPRLTQLLALPILSSTLASPVLAADEDGDPPLPKGLLEDPVAYIKDWAVNDGVALGGKVLLFLALFIASRIVAKIVSGLVRKALSTPKLKLSDLLKNFAVNTTRNVIVFLGLLFSMAAVGIPIGPFLAAFGVIGFVVGFALQETMGNFASGVMLLAQQPDVEAALRADPSLVRNFVEEVLRLESPSQGFFRYAVRAEELNGVAIPEGAMVHLRFGAANRDPAQFPNPDALDLRRPNAGSHMAFSQGEHHCIGAPLARLELQSAFSSLLQHFSKIQLVPGESLEHLPGLALRTLRTLWVDLEPTG